MPSGTRSSNDWDDQLDIAGTGTVPTTSNIRRVLIVSRLFTSESVTEGHPDKIADQISDSVLDALLAADPKSRVAAETFVTTGLVLVGGEVTTEGYVDIARIARDRVVEIGYDSST